MNASQCMRCGQFWSFMSGPHKNFDVITKWCPDCVGRMPTLGWGLLREVS